MLFIFIRSSSSGGSGHKIEKWATDEDKLTFIILARPSVSSLDLSEEIKNSQMIGDVNMFFHEPEEEGGVGDAECEVMVAGGSVFSLMSCC